LFFRTSLSIRVVDGKSKRGQGGEKKKKQEKEP
jgi:hypothetical protein